MANGPTTNLDIGLGKLNQWTGAMVLSGLIAMAAYMLTDTRDDALLEGRVAGIEKAMGDAKFFWKDYVRQDIYSSQIVNIHSRISAIEAGSIDRDAKQEKRIDGITNRLTTDERILRGKQDKNQ